jgi:predicted nucleotidyltransferase
MSSSFISIKELLQKVKPELANKYHVKSIGLFGSIVRDDFSPSKSDVDIIVEFSQPVGVEFIDLADFLEFQIKRKVDLVSRKGIKQDFYKEIEREIIYV